MKIKLVVIGLLLIITASICFSQSKIKHFGIAEGNKLLVTSYIVKDADYVVADLAISNDESKVIKRLKLLQVACNSLQETADANENITLTLSFENPFNRNSYFDKQRTQINYRIAVPIAAYDNDYIKAVIALGEFGNSLPDFENTEYFISKTNLAILNPNDYKMEILKKKIQSIND